MIKALRLLLGLAGLIVIIAFAIANRTPVAISFAPLPIAIELPVYGVFLLGLVLGGLLGGLALWLGRLRSWRQSRRLRRRASVLEDQVAALKRDEPGAAGYAPERSIMAQRASD